MALMQASGLPMQAYALFVLPHGIIEIPAAILATAAVLRMGALLATPTKVKTVSEVVIEALADWVKIFVCVVVPFLLLAAVIEIWITPRLVMWLFS